MAKSSKKPIVHLNIHLLKSSIKKASDAISNDKKPLNIKTKKLVLKNGELFYYNPPAQPPPWHQFLQPAFSSAYPKFKSKHASAVLVFPVARRMFAITFGYGRSLLSESALEPDFGIITALKLCDPSTLRSINIRTIEERTRIARIQLSDAASVGAFRMDTATDLLRGIEAECKDTTICERLGARWANLAVAARIDVDELPNLAAKLWKAYRHGGLPSDFEWIENIRRINDPDTIVKLDNELESRLDAGRLNKIRLALPEIIDDSITHEAKLFNPDGEEFDGDISVYLTHRKRTPPSTIDATKRNHHVVLVDSASGATYKKFSVYRCIVAELKFRSGLYMLIDGEWFKLDKVFVKSINDAINTIRSINHSLPDWKNKEHEEKYNKRSCISWSAAALMDRKNIPIGGGRSRIEVADWISKQRVIGHVKRRDKSSSGLSHLFSQGYVSAQILNREHEFRKKVADKLPQTHNSIATKLRRKTFDPSEWTVAYVILGSDPDKPASDLPFFSKVNLKKHVEALKDMQYKVALIGIPTA